MVNRSLILICILMSVFISTAQDHATLETLTVENIANLQLVGQLGRGEAYKLAWKPDGETLAVVSNMGVWLYDENLNQIDYWPSDYDYVWDFAWSPNGLHLAILTDESLTVLASDGTTAYELRASITTFSWHPFENLIAIATRESPVRILNSETGDEIRTIAPQGEYVAWSPDGRKLAIGADGIDIRDTTDFISIMTITEKEAGGVVQWSDDSSMLSSTCFDDEAFYDFDGICVWDANTGTLLISREVFSIIWIPDSNYRVFYGSSPFSADAGSYVIIEDDSNEPINSGYWEQLRSVVWHPNYDQLTALSFYGTLVEFDLPTGEIESQQTLYSTAVATLSISPDSTRIATTKEGIVQLWDVDSMNNGFIGQPIVSFDTDRGTYTQAFVDVRWVNADEFITLETTYSDYDSSVSQTITRRSARNGEMIELLYRIESPVNDSPAYNCGQNPNWDFTLFACIVNKQLQIYPFDLSTSLLSIPMEHAREIIWSPDNTVLAVRRYIEATESYIIELYRVGDGEKLFSVDADWRNLGSPWNSDLSLLAIPVSIEGTSNIQILDSTNYEVIDTVPANYTVWHPSENMLALSTDTTLSFWTPATGILDNVIDIGNVTDLDWSPNGRFIASAGADGAIRLWGVAIEE